MYDFSEARFSHAPFMNSRRFGRSFSTVVCQRLGLYSKTRSMLSISKSGPVPWAFIKTTGLSSAIRTPSSNITFGLCSVRSATTRSASSKSLMIRMDSCGCAWRGKICRLRDYSALRASPCGRSTSLRDVVEPGLFMSGVRPTGQSALYCWWKCFVKWCRLRDSNPRPTVYKTVALPLC